MNIDPSFPPEDHEFEYLSHPCKVKIYKKGKVTYKATGSCGERCVEGSPARTTRAALEDWKASARYSEPNE
jgi:hypothetical protein